jgi:tetratricopeptide (TPR) repeat protein
VVKSAPPEVVRGQQAIEAGNFEAALPFIKSVADKFKGLPIAWAQESTAMLGNIYVSLGKIPEAETAFADYERLYGGSNSAAAKIGKARLAAAKNRFTEAKGIASEIVSGALAKKNVSRAESQLYGQAYFILGQCAENEKKLPEAMENYCRTVAIFYQEPTIVKEAQKRIDELRKKDITTP